MVEVTLAVGITGMAMMAVLGMLPNAMAQFRRAVDLSVSSQVTQRIAAQSRQAEFHKTLRAAGSRTLYFNDQGEEVDSQLASTYTAIVRIVPDTKLPGAPQPAESLSAVAVEVYASAGHGSGADDKPLATSAALIAGNPASP